MTIDEICAAKPGPELDALVHRYYGDGSAVVPPYSTDCERLRRLAYNNGLDFKRVVIDGRVIMSLFRDGQHLEIGHSIDVEGADEADVPPAILATLAARSMLKLVVSRSDLHRVAGDSH